MKKVAKYLLKSILGSSKDIDVKEEENEAGTVLKVNVPPENIGRIIGKKGKTIKSISSLVKIKAIKAGKRVDVRVQDSFPQESFQE